MNSLGRWLSYLSIRNKLILLLAAVALGVVLMLGVAARLMYLELLSAREAKLQNQVEMGVQSLVDIEQREISAGIASDQARRDALSALASMSTNSGVSYFFAFDSALRVVLHPSRDAGADMSDYQSDGVYVYRELLQAAKDGNGSGFTRYMAPKPGMDSPVLKISRVQQVPGQDIYLVMGAYADDIFAGAMKVAIRLAVLAVAMLTVALGLGWIVARAIVEPMRRATELARSIASGHFDDSAIVDGSDESAQLLAAMNEVQGVMRRYGSELQTLVKMHAAENPFHRMPEDLPGEFGSLAKGVNAVIFEHVDAIVEAIGIMNEYGRGVFDRDARRLPGKRAILHESVDAIKANLIAMSGEISRLGQAAMAGDFSARGDAQRFEAAFREMVQSLNGLMEQADNGLTDVGRLMQAMADGDLTYRISRQYPGAFGALASNANRSAEQLSGIIVGIQAAANSIHTSAGEISSGNSDLSARTEQQAASLEETASSMEELTATVKQNADGARQANDFASAALKVADTGGRVVGEVVATMGDINQASSRIADIIGVIDGIAFQTNILALNAAVEAARAGEQGRGFAVVASEVRALAQRSASAAKEIKGLITDTTSRVETGSEQVAKAGETMKEIVTSVRRVSEIMAEITAASAEQSAGIEQVGRAVVQLDETTQQNAALVEEASAAARSMANQATDLTEAVSAFKVSQGAALMSAPTRIVERSSAAPSSSKPAAAPKTPAKPEAQASKHLKAVPSGRKSTPRATSSRAPRAVSSPVDDDSTWQTF